MSRTSSPGAAWPGSGPVYELPPDTSFRPAWLARLVGALLLMLWPLVGVASGPLVLDAQTTRLDLWPGVTVMPDASRGLDLWQVIDNPAAFEAPRTARATLGLRAEPVWLRMPIRVDSSAGTRWVLELDYPVLNRVDVYLLRGEELVEQATLGNMHRANGQTRHGRSHSLDLDLKPGADYDLLLRVETEGAMVVPATLSTPGVFLEYALKEQMLQGLMMGLSLCLVIYSMVNWLGLRDSVFAKYALLVGGGLLFSVHQFGIGAQFVWAGHTWLELHVAVLSALMSSCGFFLFFEHMLTGPDAPRHFSRMMKAGALATVLVALAHVLDVLSTRMASAFVGVLGLMPTLLALPEAARKLRQGDTMGMYIVLGALVYFSAAATMLAMIYGRAPVNFWTQHSVQLATLLDTMLLMRLLSLRSKAIQREAQRAAQERDAMHSLANTDPLTGLPNRRGLNAALTAAVPQSSADRILAVYLLDLDGFKPINDRYGHDIGDELLVAVAARLQSLTRNSDVVARLGGDEFVLLTGGLQSRAQAVDLGNKLLDAFTEPFDLDGFRCQVGLTIGYALAPLDASDARLLLRHADAGMYLGKQEGKHCLRHFDPVSNTPALHDGGEPLLEGGR